MKHIRPSHYVVYQRAATAARALLLVAGLGCVGVLAVWFTSPATVNAVDAALRAHHLKIHEERFHNAERAERRGDRAAAIAHLEEARRALHTVLKGDRLDPLRRASLERLARVYRNASRMGEALSVLDEWSAFDPRDLRPRVLKASWRGPDGLGTLEELHARFPSGHVDAALAVGLLKAGRPVDALAIAADTISKPPDRRWQVFWDKGGGFRAADSKRVAAAVDEAGALFFSFRVPLGVQRLRVDGPPSTLLIRDLMLRLQGRDSTVTLPLWEVRARHRVRKLGERTLQMSSRDSHLTVSVPASFRSGAPLHGEIRGQVMTAPPAQLTEFLASPGSAPVIDALAARGDTDRAQQLERAREWVGVAQAGATQDPT